MWHVDAFRNSLITTGNGGTGPTHAAVTLFYNRGKSSYTIEKELAPGEQIWANVGEIIRNQIPDKDGKTIPPDVTMGSYELRDLDHIGVGYDPSLVPPESILLSDTLPGANAFAPPTGLMKLLGTEQPQIVTYRQLGASCEGVLDIYNIESTRAVVKLSSACSGSCEDDVKIEDLDHDGIPEITFKTSVRNPVRAVYRWDGSEYKRDDATFPAVNDRALEKLVTQALSPESAALSARMQWFNEAIGPLTEEHRLSEALALCSQLIQEIRNPEMTTPNTRLTQNDPERNKRILAQDVIDKRNAEPSILKKMGDLYSLQGNSQKARELYRQADQMGTAKPQVNLFRCELRASS